jgi:TRAP-type C4-dicarboxylate transport system permease small subunit
MKLSKKQAPIVLTLLIAVFTTAIMSFGILWSHQPLSPTFPKLWIRDFFVGCMISIPTGLLINPVLIRLVNKMTVWK